MHAQSVSKFRISSHGRRSIALQTILKLVASTANDLASLVLLSVCSSCGDARKIASCNSQNFP
jgi:hypothetical protein